MTSLKQTARIMQVPRFDWDEHNAELDRRLAEWNQIEREIRNQESVGWAVRQIVPAKQADSRSGVKDGFLVVFERRAFEGREVSV